MRIYTSNLLIGSGMRTPKPHLAMEVMIETTEGQGI